MSSNPITNQPQQINVVNSENLSPTQKTITSLDTPKITPTIPTKEDLISLLQTAKDGHDLRAAPNNKFLATIAAFTVAGAFVGGFGAIPGCIVGCIVGFCLFVKEQLETIKSTAFKQNKLDLDAALASHNLLPIATQQVASVFIFEKASIPDLQTTEMSFSDGTSKISNIEYSEDRKSIKFTIEPTTKTGGMADRLGLNNKTILATLQEPHTITKDNLHQVLYSAIVQNEINRNQEFETGQSNTGTFTSNYNGVETIGVAGGGGGADLLSGFLF